MMDITINIDNNKNAYLYINKINNENLKNFVLKSLEIYGSEEKLYTANKVADVVWQKFEHMGYINSMVPQQQFIELTLAAALIHNLFYDKDDITTILKHRVELKEIADNNNIDERIATLVYEMVESQLGENHPIQKLKPVPNSPSSIFSDAVWHINNYKPNII